MKQEEYRACMATGLKGHRGLSKEERQNLFCIQSRLCSGKAKDEKEAEYLCSLLKPPKEPKVKRSRKSCATDMIKIAECTAPLIQNMEKINAHTLAEALQKCACDKVSKAAKAMAEMSSEQIEALQIISQVKQEYEGNIL